MVRRIHEVSSSGRMDGRKPEPGRPRPRCMTESRASSGEARLSPSKPAAVRAALCAAAFAATLSAATPALAQGAGSPDRIKINYVAPTNPAHQELYEKLKDHKALEILRDIFSPIRFPIDVTLTMRGCDGVSNAWYQRFTLTICYEYVDDIRKSLPKEPTPAGITSADAMLGQLLYVAAHEMGHATFDLLNVPIFGRTEDAADQFAAYIMLLFGKERARRLIGGAAYGYKNYVQNPTVTVPLSAFADEHSAPMQRFYNLLCIGYGADPDTFGDLISKGYLPERRAPRCKSEYGEVAFAFKQLILPYVDETRAKEVMNREWLPEPSISSVSPATPAAAAPPAPTTSSSGR